MLDRDVWKSMFCLRGEGFDRAHEFLAFKTQRALRGDDEWRASQKGKYYYNVSPYTHTYITVAHPSYANAGCSGA